MSSRFQNKYRIASARLQTWNYGNAGMYFITICTRNRKFYFGEIINGEMQLSELGKITETEWIKTVELRPDMNLELGEFVIMPNHMHGIILIGENKYNTGGGNRDDGYGRGRRDAMHCVSTDENTIGVENTDTTDFTDAMHGVSTADENPNDTNNKNQSVNQFGPQSKNLGSILRGYKSAVTTFARKNNIPFDWQARYHDHIIRSMDEYYRISNYIINNARNWKDDRFYN